MSLTSRLGLARTLDVPLALTTGRSGPLPQRTPGRRAARCPATPPARPVLAAMERAVERDHPAFQVTRAAALASLAARGEHLDSTEEMHFPGNGAARTPEGELYSLLPIASRPSWVAVPSALDLITMRAKGIMPGETSLAAAQPDPVAMPPMGGGVVLEPCAACDGPTRVAVVDLAQDSATVECVACGLRRLGIAAGAVAPLN